MGEYTKNLNLFKYDLVEDYDTVFSIKQALNDNWDKLDDYLEVPLATKYYFPFCVNSGIVGSDGLPAFLKLEGNTLKTVGSFDLTTAQGKTYTITDELTKDVSGLSDGEYNIFINPETQEISLKNNKIHIDNKFPSGAKIGDYLLNIAKPPYDLEEKTASENLIGLKEVYAGSLTVSGGGSALMLFNFNKNFFNTAKYVKKAGDTICGNLSIVNDSKILFESNINKTASTNCGGIKYKNNAVDGTNFKATNTFSFKENVVYDKNEKNYYLSIDRVYTNAADDYGIYMDVYNPKTKQKAALFLKSNGDGKKVCQFPICNEIPSTISSAWTGGIFDVIVQNYLNKYTGFVKFGSGLKIQWGQALSGEENYVDIVLPLAFNNTDFFFTCFDIDTAAVNIFNRQLFFSQAMNYTTTTNVRVCFNTPVGAFRWFAIGY